MDIDAITRAALKLDLAAFMVHIGMRIGTHHERWAELLRTKTHLAILAARGHGKSGAFSFALPLQRSWAEANHLTLIFSATEPQAARLMRSIKHGKRFIDGYGVEWLMPPAAEIPLLADIVPADWRRRWTTERIEFTNGSVIEASTFGKDRRGAHVNTIIVDDGQKKDCQWSAVERERAKSFFFMDVEPMLLPNGQIANVGTPMHSTDLHAALRENTEYHFEAFPALVPGPDGTEVPLWPEFKDAAFLAARRRSRPLAFGQEYLLRVAINEASLFPPHLWEQCLEADLPLRPSAEALERIGIQLIVAGVDIALSAGAGSDYFCMVVLGVDGHAARWFLDMERHRGMPFDRQIALIREVHRRWDLDLVFVESNQMQKVWADELKRTTDVPVKPFTTTARAKHALEGGVAALRQLAENAKLRLPRGDEPAREATTVLLDELAEIVWLDGKIHSLGEHDDTAMALWLADRALASTRFAFEFIDKPEDDEDDEDDAVRASVQEAAAAPRPLAAAGAATPVTAPAARPQGASQASQAPPAAARIVTRSDAGRLGSPRLAGAQDPGAAQAPPSRYSTASGWPVRVEEDRSGPRVLFVDREEAGPLVEEPLVGRGVDLFLGTRRTLRRPDAAPRPPPGADHIAWRAASAVPDATRRYILGALATQESRIQAWNAVTGGGFVPVQGVAVEVVREVLRDALGLAGSA